MASEFILAIVVRLIRPPTIESLSDHRTWYVNDSYFSQVWNSCSKHAFGDYYRHDGVLFKKNKLYGPICSLREMLVKETHIGGLMGHFRQVKSKVVTHGFYTPLSVPNQP
ncbi:hypothetical protein CR513_22585, partial [Mucuna pruriens]